VVRQENGANTVIRSYQNHHVYNHLEDCKIWEAARATSAASTFFDPITIGENQETYVDGALGFNNPIRLLDRESRDIWPNDDRVFLSIGTGQASDVNLEGNLFALASRLKEMVVETEKTAQGFEMDHPDLLENNRYFRFTVKDGLRGIGLEEFKARARIHAATSTYLETMDVMIRVRHFVSVISPDGIFP
jgi:predicted acylesterase/phospholipase RssA